MQNKSYNKKNFEPSQWLQRFLTPSSSFKTALDLACGSGRNGRWLISKGLRVTFLDRNISNLNDLIEQPNLEIIKADLEINSPFPLESRVFDCVVVTNYLWRSIFTEICYAVAPGGLLVYETFAIGNERFGRPSNPHFLLEPGELKTLISKNLTIIGYEQGMQTNPSKAIIQRVAAVNI